MSVLVLALVIGLGAVVSGCTVQGCGCAFVSCTLPGEQEAAQREFDRLQAAAERIDRAAQTMPINPAPFPSAAPQRYDIPVATSCYEPSTGLLRSSQLDSKAYVAPHWVAFSTMISGLPDQNALEICMPAADGGADTGNRIDVEVMRMPGQRGAELRRAVTEELEMTFVPADMPLVDMRAGRVRGVSQGITGFLAHPKRNAIAVWAGIAGDRLFVIRAECDDDAKATAVALALRRTLDSFELLPVR